MTRIEEIKAMLFDFFKGDEKKVELWLSTPNPHFGEISPNHLVEIGRAHKVEQFVKACHEENKHDQD